MDETDFPSAVEAKLRRLRIFNLVVGIVLLIQGVLMLLLSNNYAAPVMTHYLGEGAGRAFPIPIDRQVGSLRLGPMVALFLLLSGVALLLIAAPGINNWYRRNLLKGANYGRWIEYSITASIMIVVIAMLSGVYDLSTLILLFFMNAMMILFGWMMELHNQTTQKTDWTAFYFGCIAGAVPWVIIWLYFVSAASDPTSKMPGFVYGIMVSLFVFFNIFAVNMVLQYKKVGPWRDYLFGEKVYIILSLTAKALLAWQVFFPVLAL
jgi:Heliorhodopsin